MVWDPHLIKHKTLLENAQLFATRIASKQWTQSSEHLNSHFNIPSLSSRCTYYKLLVFYKFSEGYTYCPQGLLIPNTNPNSRVAHNKQFIQPFARTTSFFNSYFISSVRLWNSQPSVVVNSSSLSVFKNAVRAELY